jgi:hypothetical protein
MPSLPILNMLLRASAGARASSAAPVSEVWAVLAHPGRWTEFDPFLRAIERSPEATHDPGTGTDTTTAWEVVEGEHVLGEMRLLRQHIQIEVDHVVNRSSLATTAQLCPGLAEEVEHLLIPQASGGTLVTARITLHGPLAVPAIVPRWVFRSLAVRLLARTAESGLRARAEEIPSVA